MKACQTLLLALLLALGTCLPLQAQTSNSNNNSITAINLYQAFRTNKGKPYEMKVMQISGVATRVGPDPYALPSVEVAEAKDKHTRVLCVLPFSDYLKLRHVSKGDRVVMQGEVRNYSKEHDCIVVKNCKIVKVNDKAQ